MELTDEQLAQMVKQGDEMAMEELFARYKQVLTVTCRNFFLFGSEPEDLMQEAMLGLYKACLSYNPQVASFSTFANICIKRKVLDAIKIANSQKNKMLTDSISITTDEEDNILSYEGNPDQQVVDSENFNELKQEIFCKLSDFELIVLKYYIQGLSYSQIATRLNKSPKSIDNALSRIKQKLQPLNK